MDTTIFDGETELRTLMTRVMDAPLMPLQKKVDSLETRLVKLEAATSKNESATNNLNEALGKINKDLKNGLGDLLDEIPVVLTNKFEPMAESLSEITLNQIGILSVANESKTELKQVNESAKKTENHALRTLLAVQKNQQSVDPALAALQVTSQEAAVAMQAQQVSVDALKHSLPDLLQGANQKLALSLTTEFDATRSSIQAAVERYMSEQQKGLFSRLNLLKTLTIINLVALVSVIGFVITLVGIRS